MSFAGHVLDMLNRMKENRSMLKHKPFEKSKEYLEYYKRGELKFKEVSEEELNKIKAENRIYKKKENLKLLLAFCISIIIFSFLLFLVIKYF